MRLLLALGLVITGSGCAGWQRTASYVDNREMAVEREQWRSQDETATREYAHPAELTPSFVASCFRQLVYASPRLIRDDRKIPAIDPTRTGALSAAICQGLAEAGPEERVRFLVNNTREIGPTYAGTYTRGVAFVQPEGFLNLAFDRVAVARNDEDKRLARQDPLYVVPPWGDPTDGERHTSRFEVSGNGKHHRDGDTEYPLWIVFPVRPGG